MKHKVYQNAVEHLIFSDRLYETVVKNTSKPRYGFRLVRAAVLAAVLIFLLGTTAFAVSPNLREWTISLFKLGTNGESMTDAQVMNFTVSEDMEGVTVHYLELNKADYTFIHGMLYSEETGFIRITENYRLQEQETKNFLGFLNKNGRKYFLNLDYLETETGIVAHRKSILHKNEQGEILLIATDGSSNQWPVYVNLETGEIRDALPGWTADDFTGDVGYGYEFRDGILISTIVDEFKVVNGESAAYNLLYWIADGAQEAVLIELPKDEYSWYCENGELYYKNRRGHLFRLNNEFQFELICEYETGDDLTNGLYTVATDNGELAIVDVYSGDTFVISENYVDPGAPDENSGGRIMGDIDETMGLNATRYSKDGIIALVQRDLIAEEQRVALTKLGVLDMENQQIRFIDIENSFDGYHSGWLDDERFAVIYDSQYLCVYEFDE